MGDLRVRPSVAAGRDARPAPARDRITERLLRAAGIGPGRRVLDVGCGTGDVALLAARLVGPAGLVCGIDRSGEAVWQARLGVLAAAAEQVDILQADLDDFAPPGVFDIVVSRYLPGPAADPAYLLRRAAGLVRPGGVIALHELAAPAWFPARMTALFEAAGLPVPHVVPVPGAAGAADQGCAWARPIGGPRERGAGR
jgi:ubiquinone/menaquinone biosynthesis C-methylase UbiE